MLLNVNPSLDSQMSQPKFGQVGQTKWAKMQILRFLNFSTNLDYVIVRAELKNWAKFIC